MEEQIRKEVEELRAYLQSHGGDMELIAIEGTTVKLRLQGACGSCPGAQATLKNGVERVLREKVSEDIVVERV